MSESCQRNRSVVKLGLRAAIFALLALTTGAAPALAQSDCDTGELSREGDSEHRLAIKTDNGWRLFQENGTGSAHPLEVGDPQSSLCMAWEAPRALGRQVVYVSTRFTDQQDMSLSRRGFLLGVDGPRLGSLDQLACGFRAYHQLVPTDTSQEPCPGFPQEYLDGWHERRASYNVVVNAVGKGNLPYGSERLLTLLPLRPWKSWARIEGRVLKGNTLRVAVTYSGDGSEPPTYEYIFELR